MGNLTRRFFSIALAAFFAFLVSSAEAAKGKNFLDSEDAKEPDEPQKFLKDYDKLTKGKDADWVYFPEGSLKKYKTVMVKDFESNAKGRDARHAAADGKDYMEQWLKKQGFEVVEKGGELTVEGNIFSAWEPGTGARVWGGWMANPGVGLEVMAKDSSGKILAEVRHKARGSTMPDAVENGLEEVTSAIAAGR